MASFEELKAKYDSVIQMLPACNVRLEHLHQDSQTGKLVIGGAAPSEDTKNRLWDQIKQVDPSYEDLTCDLTIDSSLPAPVRTYTVERGDSLWKIAQHFYGNGALFHKIIAANPEQLVSEKSVIYPGDVLVIPEE